MRFKKMIAMGAVALGVLSVTGAAVASSQLKTTLEPAAGEGTSVDADNLQEGDQTSADDAAEPKEAESGSEESDGPGGHEDPPGNVDHQFEGEE